jgi:hypothetical protein
MQDDVDPERRYNRDGMIRELTMKLREPADEDAGGETQRRS